MRLPRLSKFDAARGLPVSFALIALCLSGCVPSGAGNGAEDAGGEASQNLPSPDGSALDDPVDTPDGGEPNRGDAETDPPVVCQGRADCVDGTTPACQVDDDCTDDNVCTTDVCVGGVCQWSENTFACSDSDPCTRNDICLNGACIGTPIVCPGGGVCDGGLCVDDGNAPAPSPEPSPAPPPTPAAESLLLDLGNGITMDLAHIGAGEFVMGTHSQDFVWLDHSRPVHGVTITRGFYIGKYEVTQSEWRAVMGTSPSSFTGDDRPVETVSWNDASVFVEALSVMTGYDVRLPSEAEWEYACRAGTVTEYYFGDDVADLDSYAWHEGNSDLHTHEVGLKLPNAWGLFDMHGNVWEWCEDTWHDDYVGAPSVGDPWTTDGDSTRRILRGGSWEESGVSLHRSAARRAVGAEALRGSYGFRIVVEE